MSGHSKWSKIKHTKQAKDVAKSNTFSKLARLITLAVLEGGGITDPDNNVKLRLAIAKAKHFNIPKDNIDRAIEKGSGPNQNLLKEIVYEAFAGGGIGLLIVATTDNPNRTLGEVRRTLEGYGGKLGSKGSVSYLFQKCGMVQIPLNLMKEEEAFLFAQKIGAFDVDENDIFFTIYFPYEKVGHIKDHLKDELVHNLEIVYRPQTAVAALSEKEKEKVLSLTKALEELDDVHKVFSDIQQ